MFLLSEHLDCNISKHSRVIEFVQFENVKVTLLAKSGCHGQSLLVVVGYDDVGFN
jgi:hypothetical protein